MTKYPLMLSLFLSFMLCGAEAQVESKSAAPSNGSAQVRTESMPSDEEISELLSSSIERVNEYQLALDNVKPLLDRASPEFYKRDSELCATAKAGMNTMKAKGASAYSLVALMSMLDDLSLDASRAALQIYMLGASDAVAGKKNQPSVAGDMINIAQAGKGCRDISELLLHATLRYISAEEAMLSRLLPYTK